MFPQKFESTNLRQLAVQEKLAQELGEKERTGRRFRSPRRFCARTRMSHVHAGICGLSGKAVNKTRTKPKHQ